jgi:hypothetical protein
MNKVADVVECVCQAAVRCAPNAAGALVADYGASLVPYRLLVSLVMSERVNGAVGQRHIADLGAIDGYLLPEFFVGLEPEIVDKLKTMHWRITSGTTA